MHNRIESDVPDSCRTAWYATHELGGYLRALESCLRAPGGNAIPEDYERVAAKYSTARDAWIAMSGRVTAVLTQLEGTGR